VSRYGARLRSLENRLAAACPLCAGLPAVDFVTIHGDEPPPPPPPPCEACGKLATRFIVHHAADAVAPSEQRAADLLRRAPAAESVPPAHEHNRAAETAREPRTRRRRYCGPN